MDDNRRSLMEIRRQNRLGELDGRQYEFEKAQYEKEIAEAETKLAVITTREQQKPESLITIEEMNKALDELTSGRSCDDVENMRLLLARLVDRIEVDSEARVHVITAQS
jgi:site-specific DNA recombinase